MSTRQAVEAAKAVLALCSANDPWFPKPSQATVMAWAEHIDRTNYTKEELLDGVRAFYAQGGECRPVAGDIINAARTIRSDRFMRQPIEAIEAHNDRMDARLAGRIEEVADGHSVDKALTAYRRREPNPIAVPCHYCQATPGRRCTSGGLVMRGYHPARIDSATARNTLPPGTHKSPSESLSDRRNRP